MGYISNIDLSQALISKIHIKFKVLVSSDSWPLNMIDDLMI